MITSLEETSTEVSTRGGLKNCSKCYANKPLLSFNRSESSPDGRSSVCRTCSTERTRTTQALKSRAPTKAPRLGKTKAMGLTDAKLEKCKADARLAAAKRVIDLHAVTYRKLYQEELALAVGRAGGKPVQKWLPV